MADTIQSKQYSFNSIEIYLLLHCLLSKYAFGEPLHVSHVPNDEHCKHPVGHATKEIKTN